VAGRVVANGTLSTEERCVSCVASLVFRLYDAAKKGKKCVGVEEKMKKKKVRDDEKKQFTLT